MEEMHESSSEEMNFSQEEVVWAKITGYPWWPALITANPLPGSNAFRVDFFADNTHAFVARSKLAKYQQLRGEVDLHKHMKKGLRKAIASADQAIRDRLGLTPSLPHLREAVEVIPPTQKQLLQPPFIETTPLQEKEQNPTSCLPTVNSPEEPIQDSEDHAHSQEEQQPPVLQYSLEKRQKYVNYLLKKYQLNDLTHDDQRISHKHRFRNKAGRRKEKGRTKKIVKQHHEQHRPSMMFMLSRKLHRYLKQKPELCESQRKDIVLSLTKQVEAHHPRIQNAVDEVTKLLKWLQITPANTIADYYQSWSSFQTEKEKASNMTNEE